MKILPSRTYSLDDARTRSKPHYNAGFNLGKLLANKRVKLAAEPPSLL